MIQIVALLLLLVSTTRVLANDLDRVISVPDLELLFEKTTGTPVKIEVL